MNEEIEKAYQEISQILQKSKNCQDYLIQLIDYMKPHTLNKNQIWYIMDNYDQMKKKIDNQE